MFASTFKNVLFCYRRCLSDYRRLQSSAVNAAVFSEEWAATHNKRIPDSDNLFEKYFTKLVDSVKKELNVNQNEAELFIRTMRFYRYGNRSLWEQTSSVTELVENIELKLKLLKQHFPVDEILFNSSVLFMSLGRLCYRMNYLNFFSFQRLRINLILNFQRIRFMTPQELKEIGFVSKDFDVLSSVKGVPDDVKSEIRKSLIHPETITIKELKSIISKKFSVYKFAKQRTKPMKESSLCKMKHINGYALYELTKADIAVEDIDSIIRRRKMNRQQKVTTAQVKADHKRVINASDCIAYLMNQFQLTKLKAQEVVEKHPRWYQCDINNATEVITCLREAKLTDEQIINGLYIILYKAKVVREELQKLDDNSLDEWKKHPLLLDKIIYNIDKEFIFNS